MDIISVVKEIHDKKVGAVRFSATTFNSNWPHGRARYDEAWRNISVPTYVGQFDPKNRLQGKALLFINPHQPFFGSGQWYEGSSRQWGRVGSY